MTAADLETSAACLRNCASRAGITPEYAVSLRRIASTFDYVAGYVEGVDKGKAMNRAMLTGQMLESE